MHLPERIQHPYREDKPVGARRGGNEGAKPEQNYGCCTSSAQNDDSQKWILTKVEDRVYPPEEKARYLEMYAPQVWLHSEEEYFPSSVEWSFNFLKRVFIKDRDDGKWYLIHFNPAAPTKQSPSNDDPSRVAQYFYGANPDKQLTIPITLAKTPAYSVWTPVDDKTVDLVYFFYYPYNRGKPVVGTVCGNHVGDWEHVTVRLTQQEIEPGRSGLKPNELYGAYHSDGWKKTWGSMPKVKDSQHPIIYSAKHSHGSYYYEGKNAYKGLLTDVMDAGHKWDTWLNLECFEVSIDSNSTKKVPKFTGLGPTWNGTRPNWLLQDHGDKTKGNDDPKSGPVYRWGNTGSTTATARLTCGPKGPANKPYFRTPELD